MVYSPYPCPARQVTRSFTEILEEVAPRGTGRLEMKLKEMDAVSTQQCLWHIGSVFQLVLPCSTLKTVPVVPIEDIADTCEGVAIQVGT